MSKIHYGIALCVLALFPTFVWATDHECTNATDTTCLPEDPFSIYECFGSDGWQETLICEGVCCQETSVSNAGCCCRKLDCKIGERRCFGDDMVQECMEIERGDQSCIEWIAVEWCNETGTGYLCENAVCMNATIDGDLDVDTESTESEMDFQESDIDEIESESREGDSEMDIDSGNGNCNSMGWSGNILLAVLLVSFVYRKMKFHHKSKI